VDLERDCDEDEPRGELATALRFGVGRAVVIGLGFVTEGAGLITPAPGEIDAGGLGRTISASVWMIGMS
jgi:hypothetical protein